MQKINAKIQNTKKIQGTSAGVLPQASSKSMVRDCIPWTASRLPMLPVVVSAMRLCLRTIAAVVGATVSYPAKSVKCILNFTCVDF